MASAQVVETSVTNNSPSQDSYHPDDLFQSRYKLLCRQLFSEDFTSHGNQLVTSIQEKIHTPSDSVMKQMMISGILVSFDIHETSLFHTKKKEKKGNKELWKMFTDPFLQ